jgi:hypothetical protein
MRKELGELLLSEPFLILLSKEFWPLVLPLRVVVLRAMLAGTGGAGLQFRGVPSLSSSTITTIHTPI